MRLEPVCRFAFLLAEVRLGCSMDCIPEVIQSFLDVSYREAGERFLKRSYELLHFLYIANIADVKAWFVHAQSLCSRFSFSVVSLCSTPENGQ